MIKSSEILYAKKKGRPGIPIRLLVGLTYLGHAYGLSDEVPDEKNLEEACIGHMEIDGKLDRNYLA